MGENSTKLFTEPVELSAFFYKELEEMNRVNVPPLPQEIIFYLSQLLEKYCISQNFFEIIDGKTKEKVLGLKFLEAHQMPLGAKKTVFREVGDFSLLLTGYFSHSLNKKIVDPRYYYDLGKKSYQSLDALVPEHLNIKCFFSSLAHSFQQISQLLTLLSERLSEDQSVSTHLIILAKPILKTKAS